MVYPNYQTSYGPYQSPYYSPAVPDQLGQLRQQNQYQAMNQMGNAPMMQTQAQQMQAQQPMMGQPLLRPTQDPASAQATPVDDRIWVQGEGAATSYLVVANGFVRLWDSTAPVFYEKQADAQGKPLPLRVFDYTERTSPQNQPPMAPQTPSMAYATREEFNALSDRLTALENKPCKRVENRKSKEENENG